MNLIGLATSTIVILVDYIFVSMAMGADGLAAVTFAVPVYTIVMALGMMLGVGGGAKYAEHSAKGEQEQANKYFTLAIKSAVLIAIPIILSGVFLVSPISGLLGADGHMGDMVGSYVRVVLLGSPIMLLHFTLTSFERNDGSPKVAMVAGVIASVMNIIMDYVFIIALDLGAGGVAGATMVAMSCSITFLIIYRLRKKANYRLVRTRIALKRLVGMCAVGGPTLLNTLLYSFLMIAFNLTLYRVTGNIGVAAFGLITTLAFMVQMFFTGVGQGMQPIASYFYGKGISDKLKSIATYAVVTNVILSFIVIAFINIFAPQLVSIFNPEQNAELAQLAETGLRIYFIAFLPYGITMIAISFLSVTSSPTFGLVASFLQGGGFAIPIVLIFSRIFGVTGIWATYPTAEFLLVIISIICLVRGHRIHKKMFVMNNVIIRDVEINDIPSIKTAISKIWDWSELIEDEKTINATLGIYLNQVLFDATFGRVAVLCDKVVGVIFGYVEGKEPNYRMLLEDGTAHTFTLLKASERDRFCIDEFFTKQNGVYEQLVDGIEDEYNGTLDFLILTEDAQGLGIGKKLWLSLKQYFEEHNVKSIYLYSDEDCNVGFYEHQGFTRRNEQTAAYEFGEHIHKSGIYLYEYQFNK